MKLRGVERNIHHHTFKHINNKENKKEIKGKNRHNHSSRGFKGGSEIID
jgi:hypothetical protein